MKMNIKALAKAIIEKNQLKTIEDVIELIPRFMCHITQESDVFETYNPMTIKLSYPESEWETYEARYIEYSEKIIPSLTLKDYLNRCLEGGERLPCFCSEIGDVSGAILSVLLEKTVYVIRRVFVNYLTQPTRRHCLNAIVEQGRIRYIDAAVYNQVLNDQKRLVHPSKLHNFNATDITEHFLKRDDWLQSLPYPRDIFLSNGEIKDTFFPNPDPAGLVDEYLRRFDA